MKAVIPAAGLGTRMLPLTKSQPKEMLPIFNKPTIQYVVEEAIEAGMNDILLITGKGKRAIEDHFSPNPELENFLKKKGKEKEIEKIRDIGNGADIFYVRQKSPRGLGDAIMYAEKHVGKEAFAVLLGDDIIFNHTPAIKQLMDVHKKHGSAVIGIERVNKSEISRYGIIDPGERIAEGVFEIKDVVEKPSIDEAPSDYGVIGRYILTHEIFSCLRETEPDKGGEIQLTDALRLYMQEHRILAVEIEGKRLDTGNMEGWLMANIETAKRAGPEIFEKIKRELFS